MSEQTQQIVARPAGRCRCLYKCIGCSYRTIRCCCCSLGCCCFFFWLILIWALISLSASFGDVDWDTTEDTCYHTLNVTPEATPKEIQKAFRKLALKYHPDKVSPDQQEESEKIFQQISHCYEILNDEKSRAQYNAAGYRETNQYGIPFDSEINLQDIFQFFSDLNNANDKPKNEPHANKEKRNKRTRKPKKRRHKPKQKRSTSSSLKDQTIELKLEDICCVADKQHTVTVGTHKYNIMIKGGVHNGYLIKDELNGYNWNIKVKSLDSSKTWQRTSDDDCVLYSNVTLTVNQILMGVERKTIRLIDGTEKTLNMEQYDYTKTLEIEHGGLLPFPTKRKYPKRCSAFVKFDILYPKLDGTQKRKLKAFLTSNGNWNYHNEL
eukprot:34599_1